MQGEILRQFVAAHRNPAGRCVGLLGADADRRGRECGVFHRLEILQSPVRGLVGPEFADQHRVAGVCTVQIIAYAVPERTLRCGGSDGHGVGAAFQLVA